MSTPTAGKRVVVAFPSVINGPEWSEIRAVRERYDPLARLVAAHLTLVYPFEDPASDEVLRAHVIRATSGIAAFDVVLGGVTAHENEVLFLNVKVGNDAIVHLHDVLYAGLLAPHLARQHTFVPHLTVGRLSPSDLAVALEATAGLTSPIRARVDRVSVYRIDPDGRRPVLFEVPLPAERGA
ncbi:MAG: 2'-5' RNA ligase family protein [Planctomycetes bacterium]|nr:2'-5' RNA ligase family protein [Planctomycetota bacterium]